MNWIVVLDLGVGSCAEGLPHITVQLWEVVSTARMQLVGALPPAPELPQLYRHWQKLHQALNASFKLRRQTDSDPRPAEASGYEVIEEDDITNVSGAEFDVLCQQFQEKLNDWLSAPSFHKIDAYLQTRLSPPDSIHVIIETQDSDLQRFPWHLWRFFDHYPQAEVALGTQEYAPIPALPQPRSQINVLAILGNSEGINTQRDRALLEQLPQAHVAFLVEPQLRELEVCLQDEAGWDILFFAGHSSSVENGTTGVISLNPTCSLTIAELRGSLKTAIAQGLKLAIFNSCDGLGLARGLTDLNIPQLIVMREPVPDQVAQEFLKHWLQAFSKGMPFYQAVRTAREQLHAWERDFPGASWLPVVCQNPAVVPLDWRALLGQHASPAPPKILGRQEYRNRQILLNKVQRYWIQGVLEQSSPGQAFVELGLESQPNAISGPWHSGLNPSLAAPQPKCLRHSILEYFDRLGAGRTLLILGEPGAGKTTMLLHLTRALLSRALVDAEHLIPVVFNLSSWAGPKQAIAPWLVQELSTKYQVPSKIGQSWIEEQQLLLMLDGLDEVQIQYRDACITALNQFSQDYGPEMVICCRTKDYAAGSDKLRVQAAIALSPLTPQQVQHWLTTIGPEIEGVQGLQVAIAADPTLQELAQSPLMLSIMTSASQGIKISDLQATEHLEDRRHQIFSAYIQQMFQHRGAECQCTQTQVMAWLTWLAKHMVHQSQSVFLIEALQPTWLPKASQWWYGFGVRLILGWMAGILHLAFLVGLYEGPKGLIYGLIGGVLSGLAYGLVGDAVSHRFRGLAARATHGLTLGLIMGIDYGTVQVLVHGFGQPAIVCGLVYGAIYVLAGGIVYGLIHRKIEPSDTVRWSWQKARRSLMFGLLFSGALAFVNKLIYGLAFGLILWVILGFDRRSEVETTTVPNQGIWRSLTNTAILSATVGIVSGIALTFMAVIMPPDPVPASPLAFGIVNGIIFGMVSGLLGGQGSGIVCIQHFVLRLLLWRNRYTPWNYAKFLDYATARIFLKKVGGSYVFIHRLLLEHFARL